MVNATPLRRVGQVRPLAQKLAQAAGTGAAYVTAGVPGAVLGREAMAAAEKAVTSRVWNTVSAVMKSRLADALASGDTQATVDLSSGIASQQAA